MSEEVKMRRYVLRIAGVVCLAAILMSMVSCAGEADSVGSEELSITMNSWIGWAPLYLAKDKGMLGDVELTLIRVDDTAARKSTMIAGHVDGYTSSVDNFALDSAEGVPGRQVLAFDESYGGDGVVVKSTIGSVAELRGKQVAFQRGLPSHFLLLAVLREAEMTSSDIEQVDMDADKAGAAFASGRLDAAVTWEPWISKAAEMAEGRVLLTSKDYPGMIVDTMVFTDAALSEKRAAIQTLVNAWFEALSYWSEHPEESDEIMADAYSLPVEDFRAMCEGVRFYDLEMNRGFFGSAESQGPIYEVFEQASAIWLEEGIIQSPAAAMDKIDPSFIMGAE